MGVFGSTTANLGFPSMAKIVLFCLSTLFLYSVVSAAISEKSSENQNNVLTEECRTRCEGSYPQHTYPKREPLEACLRGCRLSVIGQLSLQDRKPETITKSCTQGCQQGYEEKDSLYACKIGCKEQKMLPSPKSLLEGKGGLVNSWEGGTYFLFYPMIHAKYYCHGFLGRASYYIQYSSVYYHSAQNYQTVVVRIQEPRRIIMPVKEQQESVDRTLRDDKPKTLEIDQEIDSNSHTWKVIHHGHNWLKCVSKRSGMPVWMVLATLLLSSVFLLWLCCASTDTAPKHHEKELLLDDLLFLDEPLQLEKKPLVKYEETGDAGPLPMKVNIDATLI